MLQILESLFLQLSRLHLGTRNLQTLRKNVDVPHLYCNQWYHHNPTPFFKHTYEYKCVCVSKRTHLLQFSKLNFLNILIFLISQYGKHLSFFPANSQES